MHSSVGENVHTGSSSDAGIVWDWMFDARQQRSLGQAVEKGDVEAKAKSGVEPDAGLGRTYQERRKLLGCA